MSVNNNLKIVMFGASGAVGSITGQALSEMTQVKQLTLLNRHEVDALAGKPKVAQVMVDVTNPQTYSQYLSGHDVAVCTLGVGQPSKVYKEEFVKIDKTAVLDFATACKKAGISHFELLSSVGADAASRSFYLRTKGELQEAIVALGFDRVSIFQPSMILTPTNRYGFSQGLMLAVWPTLSNVMVGGLRKFKGIKVDALGKAIAKNVVTERQGVEILQWEAINKL